jgi:hypothetical protein
MWHCNILCSKHDIDMRMNEWNRHALFLSWNWRNRYFHSSLLRIPFWEMSFFKRLIGSYTSPYWRSGISSTSVRNSVFSRVERSGMSGKMLNFSHEWKKSQIFNKDEWKYLFLQFQLKNKACRFHSFIRMSMSCLLHKILQRHMQCSKYSLTSTRPYWRSGISSTRERNSASFHSFRYAPLVKRQNFSHSWKKSQIFNRDSCKNLLIS